MVADAERNRDEDRRLREADRCPQRARRRAYQVERILAELRRLAAGAREGPGREPGRRRAPGAQGDTPIDRLRTMTAELQQIYQILARRAQSPARGASRRSRRRGRREDDVIDAEFTSHE